MQIGVIGSFAWDVNYGRDPRSLPVEEWSGFKPDAIARFTLLMNGITHAQWTRRRAARRVATFKMQHLGTL